MPPNPPRDVRAVLRRVAWDQCLAVLLVVFAVALVLIGPHWWPTAVVSLIAGVAFLSGPGR